MVTPDWMLEALIAEGSLGVAPFEAALIQAGSVDLRLDSKVRRLKQEVTALDTRAPLDTLSELVELPASEGLTLQPGAAVVMQTLEFLRIPRDHLALIAQRSGLVRLGVQVSSSIINPGYEGNLPCLIVNHAPVPVTLYPGTPFCQLMLLPMRAAPRRDYAERSGRYQGEVDLRPSRLHEDVSRWVEPPRLKGPSPSDFAAMEWEDAEKVR